MKNWITINEPLQTAIHGHDVGMLAPGNCQNSSTEPFLAAHYQLLAHATAFSIYKNKYKVHCQMLLHCPLCIYSATQDGVVFTLFCSIAFVRKLYLIIKINK